MGYIWKLESFSKMAQPSVFHVGELVGYPYHDIMMKTALTYNPPQKIQDHSYLLNNIFVWSKCFIPDLQEYLSQQDYVLWHVFSQTLKVIISNICTVW